MANENRQQNGTLLGALGLFPFLNEGVCASARLNLATKPGDTETVGIGTDTYEFDSGGGVTPGNIAVTIGADAAACRTNLITAINTLGTVTVAAEEVGTQIRIWYTTVRGNLSTKRYGTPAAVALASGLVAPADIWDRTNFDRMNYPQPGQGRLRFGMIVMDAVSAAANAVTVIDLDDRATPANPTMISVGVIDGATGLLKFVDGTILPSAGGITITQVAVPGGGSLAVGDMVAFLAYIT